MYKLNYNEKKYFIKIFRKCQKSPKGYIFLFAITLTVGVALTHKYQNYIIALITIGLLIIIQYLKLNSSPYVIAIKNDDVKCQRVKVKRKTIKNGEAFFDSDISYNIPALDIKNFNNAIEGDVLYIFDFNPNKYAYAAIDNKIKM